MTALALQDAADEGLLGAGGDVLVALLGGVLVAHLGQQVVPALLLDVALVAAAGGQDDLDARRAAGRGGDVADGDVVQVGRVDAPLQGGGQVKFRAAALAGVDVLLLGLVDLVDEDGAADQVDAQAEAALAAGVLGEGPADDAAGQDHRHQADEDAGK